MNETFLNGIKINIIARESQSELVTPMSLQGFPTVHGERVRILTSQLRNPDGHFAPMSDSDACDYVLGYLEHNSGRIFLLAKEAELGSAQVVAVQWPARAELYAHITSTHI